MYKITIDESRALNDVITLLQRAKTAENFINQKLDTLKSNQPCVQTFMEAAGGTELLLENMYSSGGVSETYSSDCILLVHGVLTLKKEYANKKLLAKKLNDMWKSYGPLTISASFMEYQINGRVAKFTMRIK